MKPAEILIINHNIEENLWVREIVNAYDSRFNLNLHIVQNYVEAIDFLFLKAEDEIISNLQLILLEISIPNNKGRVLLHQIKEYSELKKIPLLILTQSTDPSEAEYCYNEYVNAYLCKPESKEDFFKLINKILKFWIETVSLPEHAWS